MAIQRKKNKNKRAGARRARPSQEVSGSRPDVIAVLTLIVTALGVAVALLNVAATAGAGWMQAQATRYAADLAHSERAAEEHAPQSATRQPSDPPPPWRPFGAPPLCGVERGEDLEAAHDGVAQYPLPHAPVVVDVYADGGQDRPDTVPTTAASLVRIQGAQQRAALGGEPVTGLSGVAERAVGRQAREKHRVRFAVGRGPPTGDDQRLAARVFVLEPRAAALPGQVARVQALGDDALKLHIAGGGREVGASCVVARDRADARVRGGGEQLLELGAPLAVGPRAEVAAVEREKVEGDEGDGSAHGDGRDRVRASQTQTAADALEVGTPLGIEADDLPVEDDVAAELAAGGGDLRELRGAVTSGARVQAHGAVGVGVQLPAAAVELGLERPAASAGGVTTAVNSMGLMNRRSGTV